MIIAVIAQILNPIVQLLIPTGTQTMEANAKSEIQPVTVEAKKASVQHNLDTYMSFLYFSLIKLLCFLSSKR